MQWWTTDDLCPNIVRRLRKRTRPFVSIVSPDGGLDHISVKQLHDVSDQAAWFLSRNLERDEEKFFYMGPNDIRYLIWTLGAMKAAKCVSTSIDPFGTRAIDRMADHAVIIRIHGC
jgi:acyl-coenzyme A synthetase/AMP-(fatty) acid ligase